MNFSAHGYRTFLDTNYAMRRIYRVTSYTFRRPVDYMDMLMRDSPDFLTRTRRSRVPSNRNKKMSRRIIDEK